MKRALMVAAVAAAALALTPTIASAQSHWQHGKPNRGQSWSFSFGMHQGRLGAQVTSMTEQLRSHFGAPIDAGLLVGKIVPRSSADLAGMQVGDVIIAIDGKKVEQPWDVMSALAHKKKGDKVDIEIVRNKQVMRLKATMKDSGFGNHLGGLMRQFGNNLGPNVGKQFGNAFGKDFDVIINGLGSLSGIDPKDFDVFKNWSTTSNADLGKKLKETMKRVLELEKALKQLQKVK